MRLKITIFDLFQFLILFIASFHTTQIFVAFACMAKATVQAALGPVVLKKIRNSDDASEDMLKKAEVMLMICIMSIVVTAPIGAIIISITGPKLLTKTKALPPTEGKNETISMRITCALLILSFDISTLQQVGAEVIDHHCTISVSLTKKRNVKILNCKAKMMRKLL